MSRLEQHGSPPNPAQMLAALDRGAKEAAGRARVDALAIARQGAPGSFSGENMAASTRKTPNGYEVVVQPRARVRWRAKFPEGGTGIYGPKRKPIRRRAKDRFGRPKPFVLPSGARVKEIPGQKAQHFMARNRPRAAAAASRAITSTGSAIARLAR